MEETIKAINTQKLDKSPGSDLIANELLKTTLAVTSPSTYRFVQQNLRNRNHPGTLDKPTIMMFS